MGALCATDDECSTGLFCVGGECSMSPADAGPRDAGPTSDDAPAIPDVPALDDAPTTDGGVITYGTPCTCPTGTTGCDSCRPGLLCDGVWCVDACRFDGSCNLETELCDEFGTMGGGCHPR